jgi:hypothetical protein
MGMLSGLVIIAQMFSIVKFQNFQTYSATNEPSAAFGRNQIRNTKQFQMTKNSMLRTLRKHHLINALWLCILKNEHKKQEVDRL